MGADYETPDALFARSDVVSEYASFDFLLPGEQLILTTYGDALAGWRMLDLGVGAGRTTVHFADRVALYVGVDYSQPMVAACRDRFPQDRYPDARFECGDARDLSGFDDASFDFVLFSFNGLDTVGDGADRRRALDAIARVAAPGALLAFSSHNLLQFRSGASPTRAVAHAVWRARRRPHTIVSERRRLKAAARSARRRRRQNPVVTSGADEGVIIEERPRWELHRRFFDDPDEVIRVTRYSTTPRRQVARLAEAGFDDVRVFDHEGREVSPGDGRALARAPWVNYWATRRTDAGRERGVASAS